MAKTDTDTEPESKKDWWTTPKGRIAMVRERYKKCVEHDRDNRRLMVEDMRFVNEPGEQWDEYTRRDRTVDGREVRPMYQFNRLRITIKRVINNMRANPAAGKVRPAEDSDKELADIREGMIRNIVNTSNFDSIRDRAADYQVTGGYAGWRVTADYSDDTAFDQDLKIEGLRNPLCLYCDPNAYDMAGRDATYWILTDKISKEAFKDRYPNKEAVDFETEFDDDDDWENEDKVRIAEHWYQVPGMKNLYLLDDGKTIDDSELKDAQAAGRSIKRQRPVKCYEIWSCIYSGDAELTKPAKWGGSMFPWVRVYGEYLIIDGKVQWFGLTRHAKDAQRAVNLAQTAIVETAATSPVNQNQVWATAKQAEGLFQQWADGFKKNSPAQLYNPDPAAPGPPQRIPAPTVPVAWIQLAQMMGEEIKADSGIFDESLGNESNASSGRAINARTQQGEIATFNYPANMADAIKRTWEILNDAIPHYIDTERAMRILGPDDSEKYVKVNQPAPDGSIINDLSRGKFDIVMTVGPSFSTKRQEATEAYTTMAQGNEQLMGVAGDLIIKGMDLPYAEEISERIKMMLPPQIQKSLSQDKPMPPEVQMAMAQVDQAMAQVQQQGQLVQAAAQEAQGEKASAEKAKADVQVAQANLKVQAAELKAQEAELRAHYAELQSKLAAEAQNIQQSSTDNAGAEQAATFAVQQIQQAAIAIQQQAQEFMAQAASVVAAMTQTPLVVERSKGKQVRVKRVNGELVGDVVDTDGQGPARQVRIVRDGSGDLVGEVQ